MKLNLPNRLSLIRICLVPVFIAVMMISDDLWARILGVCIFIGASVTDMLDGKIARKRNLITNFGKFIDPLADKFMVIGAMLVLLYKYEYIRPVFFWAVLIVIFRELAVTSMRLIASGSGVVVPANMLGKIKTVTQIVCICTIIIEPMLIELGVLLFGSTFFLAGLLPLTYTSIAVSAFFTLWSGISYIASMWKYISTDK
ncbi:MAG: CDP-diacylglycerol--glycerol-3-phosphate 3-phosphatidyltransferase [Clostridia bacterium]|nr:CDP-diacylglycerol--glycerol-3-phosphate 3-phosphatidyltransferase [Clostridia bacterium]MEE1115722.1 CDP-diacylglycerol--glycerol-3-phosphate 3-phosphatidyltransferase [Clostridia bacterium]